MDLKRAIYKSICNPDAAIQPEYDYIYYFIHRYCKLYLELYPNTDKNGLVKFLREIFRTLECEKVFIKEYIGSENRL